MPRRRKIDPDEVLDPDELEEELEASALDSRGLLRDGRSLRVPLYLKDGSINSHLSAVQRSIAASKTTQQTQDAVARGFGLSDGLQLHRPGFRRNTTDAAALQRVQQAYNDAEVADREAWRNPSVRLDYNEFTGSEPRNTGAGAPNRGSGAPAGAYPYSAGGEGTACSIDGRPGTLQRQGAWLVCRPTQRQDAMGLDAKQQAYLDYDREAAVAYLRGK